MTLNIIDAMGQVVANQQPFEQVLPTHALSMNGVNQYLLMSDANFGSYNRAMFSFSTWFKRAGVGATIGLISHGSGANKSWEIRFTAADKIQISTNSAASTADGNLITTATYSDTASYHHLLFRFDSANATAGDRMRLWIDGSEVTTFDTDTNPTTSVYDTPDDVYVGALGGSNTFNGLIYQATIFSGVLPSISSLYNAGSKRPILLTPAVQSLLDVNGGSVITDAARVANWTNLNTVTASATIPS